MKFRPCIDIHNGFVKQIVGSSLADENDFAKDNFVSENNADYYSKLYKSNNLKGGHIILLNPSSSPFYEANLRQAESALTAYPQGMQIGGGINDENASFFLEKGASHVIVTSFVFKNGEINFNNLNKIIKTIGKEKLVLDLSCRKKDDKYFIVTDRWQNFTDIVLNAKTLNKLSAYCDEFLVHAVDVEGKSSGIENQLVEILSEHNNIPITYAGGVSNFDDLKKLKAVGKDRIDVTIGSSLDLFGGNLEYKKIVEFCL